MPRHKAFDPDTALEGAMQVFWEKGYGATSVQDLVDRMGINRFSLYDTFGDKRRLFLSVLDRYAESSVERGPIGTLERSSAGVAAISEFFAHIVQQLESDDGWRGCLMTNSMVELGPYCNETAARVAAHQARLQAAFHRALARAHDRGELAGRQDLADLARFFTGSVVGLSAIARSTPEPSLLERYVEVVLSVLEPGRPVSATSPLRHPPYSDRSP